MNKEAQKYKKKYEQQKAADNQKIKNKELYENKT